MTIKFFWQLNFVVVNNQARSSTLIDLVVTNDKSLIKYTKTPDLGISDHMLVHAVVRTKISRPPPKIIRIRNLNTSTPQNSFGILNRLPWLYICSVFDNPDDCYWAWQKIFNEICSEHAPYRDIKLRRQSLPWINANSGIRKSNGTLEITDTGKANILNECLPPSAQKQVTNLSHI